MDIVVKSMRLVYVGAFPNAKTPLVEFDAPLPLLAAVVKSPKSFASPVVEIVTKSIIFPADGDAPPAKTPLTFEEHPKCEPLATVKSPKSCALPVVDIVINSIRFNFVLKGSAQPPNKPRALAASTALKSGNLSVVLPVEKYIYPCVFKLIGPSKVTPASVDPIPTILFALKFAISNLLIHRENLMPLLHNVY